MIFGHIDAAIMVTGIELHEYGKFYFPPFRVTPKVHVYPNGDFIAVNLKPGKYYISKITLANDRVFRLAALKLKPYQLVFAVEKHAITYTGSYSISGPLVYDSRARGDEFYFQKSRLPGERAILRRMYEITDGTGWQARIDRRLKELRL